MIRGHVIYRRKVDDAFMVYDGEVDGWDMAHIVAGGQEFESHTLFALLARGGWEPTPAVPLEQDEEVAKHLQGTEFDHDQSTHAPGQSVEGSRLGVTQTNDTTFQYEYGDFTITTDFTSAELLDDLLEGGYYSEDNPPPNLAVLGEIAADYQWDQWEGNFVMRHLAAAAMGLPHPYASGGEQFGQDIVDGIMYGERPSDEGDAEQVQQMLNKYAATTHAMLQAVADEANDFSPTWEGTVRRGMVVPVNEFGEGPLFYLREGDTLDIPLSGFTPAVTLLDKFLRGGEQSRETMQSGDDFVIEPRWRSVVFEMDTSQAKTLTPSGWSIRAENPPLWVHTSYEDRAADQTDLREFGLEPSRSVPAPWEVITQGKFRVTGTRDEDRQFAQPWAESGTPLETESMRVITIQQTAVYNPRTQTYDALPGFVTLPDGQVVPIEEAE